MNILVHTQGSGSARLINWDNVLEIVPGETGSRIYFAADIHGIHDRLLVETLDEIAALLGNVSGWSPPHSATETIPQGPPPKNAEEVAKWLGIDESELEQLGATNKEALPLAHTVIRPRGMERLVDAEPPRQPQRIVPHPDNPPYIP